MAPDNVRGMQVTELSASNVSKFQKKPKRKVLLSMCPLLLPVSM